MNNNCSIEYFISEAKKNPGKVAVPGANNEEAMEAIGMALNDGVINGGFLLGNRKLIQEMANKSQIDLRGFEIIDTIDDAASANQAAQLVANGQAHFLLKGQVDTKIYLKAVLAKELGLVESGKTLTHVGVLSIPTYHKLLLVTDAAILIEPGVEEKIKMIENAIDIARKLGIKKPKVSIQAAVEKVNLKMRSTVDAEKIVIEAKNGRFPDAFVEGPHDLYIGTSIESAKIKKATGEVCGDADILIFNDINCANLFYKAMHRFVPQVWAAGLVAGAKKPILLPSRADESQTKRMSILLAAYCAAQK